MSLVASAESWGAFSIAECMPCKYVQKLQFDGPKACVKTSEACVLMYDA